MYVIETYDSLNNEFYHEIYETRKEQIAALNELLDREDISLNENEYKELLQNGFYSYGYDHIEIAYFPTKQ